MTPREFLSTISDDPRLVTGAYYPQAPLELEAGDRVGVVLLNVGGPTRVEDVEPFLYNLFMDPAIIDLPVPNFLRHRMARFVSRRRAKAIRNDYRMIGGSSPLNRHTREQARALERRLNDRFGALTGATFTTYVAMRYWNPTSEEAAAQMAADGVTKVVLLPLYPQYSKTTTGSSLAYWKSLEEASEIPTRDTTFVYEYSAHPKYIQAISERIDEGLQRFPHEVRDRVHLVFSAHGTPLKELEKRHDPYCCLVHSTVQRVMDHRQETDPSRPFHTAFQGKVGPAKWLTPSLPDTLEDLVDEGHAATLVIPVAFVSDHIETAYALDIEVRNKATELGIEHYEVTRGLNGHPLFIEALAESVAAQVSLSVSGDGAAANLLPSSIPELPRYMASARTIRCERCPLVTEACDWSLEPATRVPVPKEVRKAA